MKTRNFNKLSSKTKLMSALEGDDKELMTKVSNSIDNVSDEPLVEDGMEYEKIDDDTVVVHDTEEDEYTEFSVSGDDVSMTAVELEEVEEAPVAEPAPEAEPVSEEAAVEEYEISEENFSKLMSTVNTMAKNYSELQGEVKKMAGHKNFSATPEWNPIEAATKLADWISSVPMDEKDSKLNEETRNALASVGATLALTEEVAEEVVEEQEEAISETVQADSGTKTFSKNAGKDEAPSFLGHYDKQ